MERFECERMFVAVLSYGSFAAAAKRLGASGGQASKLVSKLEADLGTQLIQRTTRALAATEAGRAYYAALKPLLAEFDALTQSVRQSATKLAGRLRVTAPMSFGEREISPLLVSFAQRYREIELDVSFSDRWADLVREGFDIAIRIGAPIEGSLIARRLCPMRIVIVAAPAYLAQEAAPQTPDDLAGHDCIIDTNFTDPEQWRFRAADGRAFSRQISGRLHFANAQACVTAALAGLGIARVPSFVAGAYLREQKLMPVLSAWEQEPTHVFALYAQARHLDSKIRAFVDFLVDHYRKSVEWDRSW